ncbi:MalY/PatB family protein [Lacticaseibacillus parakribbianus]|uniref:MalY/PatB family protein n=1 Tax=Lacticaseibacillus parakribbianus TaxID=2970927 RepID=UPI0021CB7183|nr:PatB family C-S lyase [Lacticaseibacillus parakribbianus]
MYDFTSTIDRRHTDSIKWSGEPGELPMWIADMDFQVAPEIQQAMQDKVAQGVFGYEEPHADYFQAVSDWYAQEHHATLDADWLLFATGVIPALSATLRRVTNVGDSVVVTAPVYNMFYNSIENSGRHTLSSDLVYDPAAHTYAIDFADLAAKLAQPLTTAMVLCNPHNPVGRIWTRAELTRIATLCSQNGVTLVADEIHGDLRLGTTDYVPTFSLPAALRDRLVVLCSPSKTFNVAALHAATVIVPNPQLRAIVARGLGTDEVNEPNLLAIPGTIAAYTQGHAWLAALREKLQANLALVQKRLSEAELPIALVKPDATYLLWLDTSAISHDSTGLAAFLLADTGLKVSAGADYRGNGRDFLRLNIACPTPLLEDGLARLTRGLHDCQQRKDAHDQL